MESDSFLQSGALFERFAFPDPMEVGKPLPGQDFLEGYERENMSARPTSEQDDRPIVRKFLHGGIVRKKSFVSREVTPTGTIRRGRNSQGPRFRVRRARTRRKIRSRKVRKPAFPARKPPPSAILRVPIPRGRKVFTPMGVGIGKSVPGKWKPSRGRHRRRRAIRRISPSLPE